ncbi:Uncharacterized protein FWK35_00003385, partial [Aphis craccivora]
MKYFCHFIHVLINLKRLFFLIRFLKYFVIIICGPNKNLSIDISQAFFSVFLGKRTAWMFGNTPPWAMVTPDNNLFNSSSFLMASCKCLGMIRDFLLSRAALPANSKTSAAKYSMTAAKYTGAPAPTRSA